MMKTTSHKDVVKMLLSEEEQRDLQKQVDEEVSKIMTLKDLRLALGQTQSALGEKMHTSQEHISRIENRGDVLCTTLKNYISALGGDLQITARFPNRKPVTVTLSELAD